MTVKLYAFTCGCVTIPRFIMLEGAEGFVTVPCPSYLIVHPKGTAIFDTGLHINCQHDPVAHIGTASGADKTGFHFEPGEELAARLQAMQVDPARIDYVVNSHLHYDHAGGNAQLPNAGIVLQQRELDHARNVGNRLGYVESEWNTGQPIKAIKSAHDLFGDGSVVCFPSYGHTPGHQSLRVRTAKGEYVLCGDACYLKESVERLHAPGIVFDREAALDMLKRFAEMQQRGVQLIYGHDPEFWKSVPQAPVQLA